MTLGKIESRKFLPGRYSLSKLHNMGDRGFCSAAPRLWSTLPDHLRAPQTVDSSKRSLKTPLAFLCLIYDIIIIIFFFFFLKNFTLYSLVSGHPVEDALRSLLYLLGVRNETETLFVEFHLLIILSHLLQVAPQPTARFPVLLLLLGIQLLLL